MALSKMSWDELNQLVGYKISEPYDEYFDPMQISEEQKQKRIKMAEEIESVMTDLLIEMFYAEQYDTPVFDVAYRDAVQAYIAALVVLGIEPDDYLQNHAEEIIANVLEVLSKHQDDPWFYSKDRAIAIAENESNSIWAYTEYEDAVKNKHWKTWNTIIDGRERDTHHEINGKTIPINDLFELPGGLMAYPKDLTYDPDPDEYENCRCVLSFS